MSKQQFGQVCTVPGNGLGAATGPSIRAIQTPIGAKDALSWTVSIQAQSIPQRGAGTLYAIIRYGVGGVQLAKPAIPIRSTNLLKGIVVGTYVQVDLYIVGSGTANPGDARVNVGAQEGGTTGADGYMWGFVDPLDGVDNGQLATGPGVLGQLHVSLEAVGPATPAAPLFLLLFDNTVPPSPGDKPIRGGVSDGLTGLSGSGGDDSYSDELAPGALGWSGGLWVALSTTAGSYTAPASGAQMHCEAKVGV